MVKQDLSFFAFFGVADRTGRGAARIIISADHCRNFAALIAKDRIVHIKRFVIVRDLLIKSQILVNMIVFDLCFIRFKMFLEIHIIKDCFIFDLIIDMIDLRHVGIFLDVKAIAHRQDECHREVFHICRNKEFHLAFFLALISKLVIGSDDIAIGIKGLVADCHKHDLIGIVCRIKQYIEKIVAVRIRIDERIKVQQYILFCFFFFFYFFLNLRFCVFFHSFRCRCFFFLFAAAAKQDQQDQKYTDQFLCLFHMPSCKISSFLDLSDLFVFYFIIAFHVLSDRPMCPFQEGRSIMILL